MQNSFSTILRVLYAEHVDFILVGGLSAVMNGAPAQTKGVAQCCRSFAGRLPSV
jgi:hypothetical protein